MSNAKQTTTKQTKSAAPKIMNISTDNYDKSRLFFDKPEKIVTGTKEKPITIVKAPIFYKNNNGDKLPVYVKLPDKVCTIWPSYPMNVKKDDEGPDTIEGYTLSYQETSLKTMDKPTDEEILCTQFFDDLTDAAVEYLDDLKTTKEWKTHVPLLSGALLNADSRAGLKPIFIHPNKEVNGAKVPDHSKPRRATFKLICTGKGRKLRVDTKIYGPGDKLLTSERFVGKSATYEEPYVKLENLYFGQHGPNSPYGVSFQIKLAESNFIPYVNNRLPTERLGKSNSSKEDDFDEGTKGVQDDEEEANFDEKDNNNLDNIPDPAPTKQTPPKKSTTVAPQPATDDGEGDGDGEDPAPAPKATVTKKVVKKIVKKVPAKTD